MRSYPFRKFLTGLLPLALLAVANVVFAGSGPTTNFTPMPIPPANGQGMPAEAVAAQTVGGVGAPPGAFGVTPTASPVPFNPYTGNVSRVVTDLKVPSASEIGLDFKRYFHSRNNVDSTGAIIGSQILGNGGNWRHSFEWDFIVAAGSFANPTDITLVYPDGSVVDFYNSASPNPPPNTSPSIYRPLAGSAVTDFIVQSATTFVLVRNNNQAYSFTPTAAGANLPPQIYTLTQIIDSKGNVTKLHWNVEGMVGKVGLTWQITLITDPGGISLSLTYTPNQNVVINGTATTQVSLNSVYTNFNGTVLATYTYKLTPANTYGNSQFETLTQVSYQIATSPTAQAHILNSAYYMCGPPTLVNPPPIHSSSYIAYPLLLASEDIHADGPHCVAFKYATNDSFQCGTVQEIHDYNGTFGANDTANLNGALWESTDLNPATSTTAGVIYTSTTNATTEYLYTVDNQGKVLSITDKDSPNSISYSCWTSYSVDMSGNITTKNTDANSYVTQTVRTSTGQITSITYPPTGTETVAPSESWQYTTPTSSNYYTYLQNHIDCRGNETIYLYQSNPAAAYNYEPSVLPTVLQYINYADGTQESYGVTASPALSAYPRLVQVTSHKRRNGYSETYQYSGPTHQLSNMTDAEGHLSSYVYNSNSELSDTYNANRVHTHYLTHDLEGGPSYGDSWISATMNDNTQTFTYYNVFAQLIWKKDRLGNITSYTYDDVGRLTCVSGPAVSPTDSSFHAISYTYNFPNNSTSPDTVIYSSGLPGSSGYIAKVKKATTNEMLWGYRPLFIRTSDINNADSSTVGMTYDFMGNVATVSDSDGKVTHIYYDQRNRKNQVTDPKANNTYFSYDDNSNVTKETSPTSVVTNAYDSMNRLDDCLVSTGTTTNQHTHYAYDSEDNLKFYYSPNNPDNTTGTYSTTNADYSYFYDGEERLTSMVYPDATSEVYTYDGVGNVLTYSTRDGRTEKITYDNIKNEPTTVTWYTTSKMTSVDRTTTGTIFAYNPKSYLLTSVSNGIGDVTYSTIAYTYDYYNRVTSTQETGYGLTPQTTSYTYNKGDDTLAGMTYPDGAALSYTYGGRDELQSIQQVQTTGTTTLVTYGYDPARCIQKVLGPATGPQVTTAYGYDDDERLTSAVSTSGASTLQSFAYDYDGSDRAKYVKRTYGPGDVRTSGLGDVYTYDSSDQLTQVEYNAANPDTTPTGWTRLVSYNLDNDGNRTDASGGVTGVSDSQYGNTSYTVSTGPNNDQYSHVGSSPVTYAKGTGRLSSYAGWTYTYDGYGHITQAVNGATTETFRYDPLGRCVGSYLSTTATTTYYFYGAGWDVLEEITKGGNFLATISPHLQTETQRYVHGGSTDEVISKTSNPPAGGAFSAGTTIFYNYDGGGNVTQLTQMSGSSAVVLEQYSYDVYGTPTIMDGLGNVLPATGYTNRYLFAGREYDAITKLCHYRAREYSPALGRFLQPDPIGHAGDATNLYRFCGNNPVCNGDPSGLDDDGGNDLSAGAGDWGSSGITLGNSGGSSSDDTSLSAWSLDSFDSFSGGFGSYGIVTGNQSTLSIPAFIPPATGDANPNSPANGSGKDPLSPEGTTYYMPPAPAPYEGRGVPQIGQTCMPTVTAYIMSRLGKDYVSAQQVEKLLPINDWDKRGMMSDKSIPVLTKLGFGARQISPSEISAVLKSGGLVSATVWVPGATIAGVPVSNVGTHQLAIIGENENSWQVWDPATATIGVARKTDISTLMAPISISSPKGTQVQKR